MGEKGSSKSRYSHPHIANTKSPPTSTLFLLVSLNLFCFYFYSFPPIRFHPIPVSNSHLFAPEKQSLSANATKICDYSNGKWVHDSTGPLYNKTTCGTIKEGRNCMSHGRPDMGFLHWRWEPSHCNLSQFEPNKFLRLLANKHLAFAGDSLARNQLESLLCMVATVSVPDLVYSRGDNNEFRRWYVASHNLTISLYWSPFMVKTVERPDSNPNGINSLYLDFIDERWASELDSFDMIVLTLGTWFLLPGVYYKGNDHVLGCHPCNGLNHTKIGFHDMFRMALKTTIETIKARREKCDGTIDIVVTTFLPSHFDGEWDKSTSCSKNVPFEEGEREPNWVEVTMRQVVMEEVEAARSEISKFGRRNNVKIEALDVTKLSLMRPDGHPGPYIYPFPFRNGAVAGHVQYDCVHWCLPGPIDTWNEILLELVKRW